MDITRREALTLIGTGIVSAQLAGSAPAGAQATTVATPSGSPPAYRGDHQPKPLPFDPAKLKGISEKLITSHHQNNYSGAVKRLNQIQQQLGQMPKEPPPYQVGALKREELIATNSMILHELYFANLGGDGESSGTVVDAIKQQYGSFDTWSAEFRLTGQALGGGSGWVILNSSAHDGTIHTYWAGDHAQNLAWGTPLLVMDMYEHAYQMDYGANARDYIDAFFHNVNWAEVNRRLVSVRTQPLVT